MRVRKPKADDDIRYDESLPYLMGTGSYQRSTQTRLDRKVKEIKIVGFVRAKKKP